MRAAPVGPPWVAGVRPRPPERGPGHWGLKTDPSHPTHPQRRTGFFGSVSGVSSSPDSSWCDAALVGRRQGDDVRAVVIGFEVESETGTLGVSLPVPGDGP